MKALEKDRNRRYETANGFAADVQRYLDDEPVQACPPSAGYRLRKFVRRNKGPVLAAALVLLALVGGIIGTTWGGARGAGALRRRRNGRKASGCAKLDAERREPERPKARRKAEDAEKQMARIRRPIPWRSLAFWSRTSWPWPGPKGQLGGLGIRCNREAGPNGGGGKNPERFGAGPGPRRWSATTWG